MLLGRAHAGAGPVTVVDVPDGSPFGLANLPYGVFSVDGRPPRIGVAVDDEGGSGAK